MDESPHTAPADRALAPASDEATRQVRGSSLLLAGRLLGLTLGLVSQIVVVRYLSKTDFGVFAFAVSAIGFVQLVASLGQERSVSRFLAVYDEEGRPDRVLGTLALYLTTVVTVGIVILGVGVLVAGPMTDSLHHDDARLVLLVLLALAPLDALDKLFESTFAVFARPRAIFVRKHVLQPVVKLAVIVTLVVADQSVVFLAVGHVVAGALGVAIYAVQLPGLLRRRGLLDRFALRSLDVPVRDVLRFSVPLLSGELVYLSMNTVSVVLLGWIRDAEEVGAYRAIFPPARLNQLVLFSFSILFVPLVARHVARGVGEDGGDLHRAYWQTAAWVAVLSFPVLALTVPLAGPTTVLLLGDRYGDSAPFLAMLSVGFYANAAFGYNQQTLQIHGRIRWVVGANVVSAVVNVALSLAFVPMWGAGGVAAANLCTLLLLNLLNQVGLGRHTTVSPVDGTYRGVYATIVVAAVALLAVEVAIDPPGVAAVVLAAAASLVVLRVNRRRLRMAEVFPEIARIPVLRSLLA